MTTTPQQPPAGAADINSACIHASASEVAALVAGALALIRPFMKTDDDIEAAGRLLCRAETDLFELMSSSTERVTA